MSLANGIFKNIQLFQRTIDIIKIIVHNMKMNYTVLDTSEKIQYFLKSLHSVTKIAVDFESESNLHIYGEHLCLVQIFDGENYYLLDPRSGAVSEKDIVDFLTHPIEKVWFSVSSDHALVYKKYNTKITNIFDIRALALTLGFEGNLTSLVKEYLNVESDISNKKALQKTNWLRRPLSTEQIDYALSDVEHLLTLQTLLQTKVTDKKLEKEAQRQLKKAHEVSHGKPGWTKLCNWKKLTKEQQSQLKEYFLARDSVAKKNNVPAHLVLAKDKVVELGKTCPKTEHAMLKIVGIMNIRFAQSLKKALSEAFSKLN